MKVLVIGQGGREHALVKALMASPSVSEVHSLPGSDAIARDSIRHDLDWQNFDSVIGVAKRHGIDLAVIGPEVPLDAGMSDALRSAGIDVFGPSGEAAKLESSKVYSKNFMLDAGVPTARSEVVSSVQETSEAMKRFSPPFVLKADGLAAGKGVFICKTEEQLLEAARSIFDRRELGDAGSTALLEEFTPGYEVSYLVLTNGEGFEPLILAQDHKRLLDGDEGPNTGGMGVVAPVQMESELRKVVDREVIEPTVRELKRRGLLYRGVIFVGLMMTPDGPSVLEYNVRFGDPETQVILPLMSGDWGVAFRSLAKGELPKLSWMRAAACCVVMAAEGYPDSPVKGVAIEGLTAGDDSTAYVLHAGTRMNGSAWQTNGGRVLNVIGLGSDMKAAVAAAYARVEKIKWPGMQFRRDIGKQFVART